MKKPLQPPLIRIIDDDAQALEAVDFMLKCEGYSTVAYSSAAEFLVDDIPSRPGCLLSDIRSFLMNCSIAIILIPFYL